MTDRPAQALADLRPDPWTAIAVATHEQDADIEALGPALLSPAGYVGVLGSRRRLDQRIRHLPVCSDGALVGIVSIGDVVKHKIDALQFERDQLDSYVHQS